MSRSRLIVFSAKSHRARFDRTRPKKFLSGNFRLKVAARTRQENEILLEQKVEQLSGLVDVDLDEGSSVRESKPVALGTLGHQDVFNLQVGVGMDPGFGAEVLLLLRQFLESGQADDVERRGRPSTNSCRDQVSGLLVADVVDRRRVDRPPVRHRLGQRGQVPQVLLPLCSEFRKNRYAEKIEKSISIEKLLLTRLEPMQSSNPVS